MLAPGEVVGGYRIEGILGRGGMGVVYEATQLSLGRTVALKVLATDLSESEDFRTRFRREGRIQAGIDHDHIVTVYEAGELDEGLYIAMRIIHGSNLKELIRAGRIDPARAVRILGPVAEALDTAHEVGLVHRDVKPQNILVGKRDHGYLADFGLTRGETDTALTRTGVFVGTLDYVAPEQLQGESPSSSSDLYALGAVSYECLTGQVPFGRATEAAVMFAHMSEPPPKVTAWRTELPYEVDEVIAQAMAKDKTVRHRSASEMIEDLARALGDAGRSVGPTPRSAAEDAGRTTPSRPMATREAPQPERQAPTEIPTEIETRRPAQPDDADRAVTTPTGELAAPTRPAAVEETVPAAGEWVTTELEAPPTKASAEPEATRPAAPAQRERTAKWPTGGVPTRVSPRDQEPGTTEAPYPAAGGRRRTALFGVGVVGLFAIATATGTVVAGGDDAPQAKTLKAGKAAITAPKAWDEGDAPQIDGLKLRDSAGARPAGAESSSGLAVGLSDGRGRTLLPAAFLKRLNRPPAQNDAVRLGALRAYRYRGLRPKGANGPLTLFALPTSAGVLTIACSGTASQTSACERAAGTLRADGLSAQPLGPRKEYAKPIGGALKTLASKRSSAARKLESAKTPSGQAAAADALHDAHANAATAISKVDSGPLEALAHRRLRAALRGLSGGYRALARAARSGDGAAYNRARGRIRGSEQDLQQALDALESAGYTVR